MGEAVGVIDGDELGQATEISRQFRALEISKGNRRQAFDQSLKHGAPLPGFPLQRFDSAFHFDESRLGLADTLLMGLDALRDLLQNLVALAQFAKRSSDIGDSIETWGHVD